MRTVLLKWWKNFQRRRSLRKSHRNRLQWHGYSKLRVFNLVAITVLGATSIYFFLRSDIFLIRHVEINPNNARIVLPDKIESLINPYISSSIFAYDRDSVEEMVLKTLPSIRSFESQKRMPDKLMIAYSEFDPILIIKTQQSEYLVAGNGNVFGLNKPNYQFTLPVVTWEDNQLLNVPEAQTIPDPSAILGTQIDTNEIEKLIEIASFDFQSIKTKLISLSYENSSFILQFDGWKTTLSNDKAIADQLAVLQRIIEDAETMGKKIESVDLRFTRAVVRYL